MPRRSPNIVIFDPDDFALSPATQASINQEFEGKFDSEDFAAIAEILGHAHAEWVERREAPEKKKLARHIKAVETAAKKLRGLLIATDLDSAEAVDRIRYAGEEGEESIEEALAAIIKPAPDIVSLTVGALNGLLVSAEEAFEELTDAPELRSGGDARHLDVLLQKLTPIAARRGLQTSFTTAPLDDRRTSDLVKLACACTVQMPLAMGFFTKLSWSV